MTDITAPRRDEQPIVGRRELLLGATLLGAAGIAYALDPRQHVSELGSSKLDALVPAQIGDWKFATNSGLVLPPQDQLRDTIYSQLLTRVYEHPDGAAVMLLIAYSGSQDGIIQVHRPETCYPASGYRLVENIAHDVPLADGRHITGRYILADNNVRREQLIYWTRLGHYFPTRWADQRIAVARENLAGRIPDGVLVRVSALDTGSGPSVLDNFARALFAGVPDKMKKVLVGG